MKKSDHLSLVQPLELVDGRDSSDMAEDVRAYPRVMAKPAAADDNAVQDQGETDNQQMGRGHRRLSSDRERIQLADTLTRHRLAPPASPRDELRRRYQALKAPLDLRPHQLELVEEMESWIVHELELEEAMARLSELESLNQAQLMGMLRHEREHHRGEVEAVELVHLPSDGSTVEQVKSRRDWQNFRHELCWPYEEPDLEESDVYVARDADGMCNALVIAQAVGPTRSGRPGALLVTDIGGRFPGEDDDCWYEDSLDEAPLREWFAHLLASGRQVRWAELDYHAVDDLSELLEFLWQFNASPRRYVDGFDERFGFGGPAKLVDNSVSIGRCLTVCADGTYLKWTDFPSHLADGFFVVALLGGQDINGALATAVAQAAEHRRSCADDREWQTRFDAVITFVDRFSQLVESVGAKPAALTRPLPPVAPRYNASA
jgi:hypothetical protein